MHLEDHTLHIGACRYAVCCFGCIIPVMATCHVDYKIGLLTSYQTLAKIQRVYIVAGPNTLKHANSINS